MKTGIELDKHCEDCVFYGQCTGKKCVKLLEKQIELLEMYRKALYNEFNCFGSYNKKIVPCKDNCGFSEVCRLELKGKANG